MRYEGVGLEKARKRRPITIIGCLLVVIMCVILTVFTGYTIFKHKLNDQPSINVFDSKAELKGTWYSLGGLQPNCIIFGEDRVELSKIIGHQTFTSWRVEGNRIILTHINRAKSVCRYEVNENILILHISDGSVWKFKKDE